MYTRTGHTTPHLPPQFSYNTSAIEIQYPSSRFVSIHILPKFPICPKNGRSRPSP